MKCWLFQIVFLYIILSILGYINRSCWNFPGFLGVSQILADAYCRHVAHPYICPPILAL